MMHIGIDARLNYYRVGGISTYTHRIIQALEAIDTEDQYTIFHSRKAGASLTQAFQRANLWTPCHHRLERITLSVELLRYRLDILHSPDFIPPLRGAKYHIITVHDLNFLHYPQFLTPESFRYYNGQIKQAVTQADHIFADSEATKQDIIDMLNVPAEKITTHKLGVDEHFRPLPAEILEQHRATLNLPPEYFLFVGTFEPRKNIVGLLEAYQQLIAEFPDAPPLVLAGNRGWNFDEMMTRVVAMDLSSHILWRESIAYDALPALYNMAIALITPSFYEGFGLPALEAMACGTVPIVSNRSSLPEVVGDVGLQINPDDPTTIANAMRQAMSDSQWRATMQQAGLRRARQFTWSQTAQVILSVYRQFK
ncbi:MAG: glycosyltransferase family 1 protein [Chloroflexi bacterium]|nr:MAG: glycosyltransferase family 1 protein [Phototrophicales bacterium]RMF78423.1 MAG: glycosyltransferase family 1 protein [Chloroflexota bacterium]